MPEMIIYKKLNLFLIVLEAWKSKVGGLEVQGRKGASGESLFAGGDSVEFQGCAGHHMARGLSIPALVSLASLIKPPKPLT